MSAAELKSIAGGQAPVKLSDMKPKDQIAYLLNQKKGEIAKMLPAHLNAERLMKVAQIAATTTPALAKCDVPSLIGAIGQCAQMGLEPNTVLGHAYLVPFNTKRKDADGNEKWVNSVQVIIGYKGLIDLARRSGQIVSIAAHEVCENDQFNLVYGLDEKLEHKPALGNRGEIIGFYAVAKLVGGGYAFEWMSSHQVLQIRDASQGYQQAVKWKKEAAHPWTVHFPEMGRKTVIRRLAKYLPLSIEFQTAAAIDEQGAAGVDQHLDATLTGDYSLVTDDAPQGEEDSIDMSTGEVTGGNAQRANQAQSGRAEAVGQQGTEAQQQSKPRSDNEPSQEELDQIRAREMAEAAGDNPEQQKAQPRGRRGSANNFSAE